MEPPDEFAETDFCGAYATVEVDHCANE